MGYEFNGTVSPITKSRLAWEKIADHTQWDLSLAKNRLLQWHLGYFVLLLLFPLSVCLNGRLGQFDVVLRQDEVALEHHRLGHSEMLDRSGQMNVPATLKWDLIDSDVNDLADSVNILNCENHDSNALAHCPDLTGLVVDR